MRGMIWVIFLFVVTVSAGVSARGLTDADRNDTCVILRSAERFMAVEYPDFGTLEMDPVIMDRGNKWEIYYDFRQPKQTGPYPKIITGFDIHLYLDKQTLKVVDHVVYQP